MEENNQNNVNAEDIKKEAKETVNQVKDSFKNMNMKQETEKTKNYFSRFIKEPVTVIKEIAHDKSNSFFKTAIVLLVVWILVSVLVAIVNLITSLFSTIFNFGFEYVFQTIFRNILNIVKSLIVPIISVAVLSASIYFTNSKHKKSFLTTAVTIMAAKIPVILAEIISILTIIPYASRITSPVSGLLGLVSTVLTFFAIKELNDEESNDGAVKKFLIVEGIYYIVKFVLSFLTIYI